MTPRRTSARVAAKSGSAQNQSSEANSSVEVGSKRKAENGANGDNKRGRKATSKAQTTIEDSMPTQVDQNNKESKVKQSNGQQQSNDEGPNDKVDDGKDISSSNEKDSQPAKTEKSTNGFDEIMKTDDTPKNATPDGTGSKVQPKDDAVEVHPEREQAMPSSILEKGIIYFFLRGRVGVDEPSDVNEVARSYLVLRPLPKGAALGDGPIGDSRQNRLFSLPKKVFPLSGKDQFMTFVTKTNVGLDDIKEQLSSSEYATKTAGVRHTPSANPIAEGVYAFVQTGRTTHLAYAITVPEKLDEVQKSIGLKQQGSFITSAKNPQAPSPANASLPQGAEYPKGIQDEFAGRGWMPLHPKLLNYENTQILLIGHGSDSLESATKPQDGEDKDPNKETPLEEIQKLEEEDTNRTENLEEDHAVFADLGLSSKEHSKIRTDW